MQFPYKLGFSSIFFILIGRSTGCCCPSHCDLVRRCKTWSVVSRRNRWKTSFESRLYWFLLSTSYDVARNVNTQVEVNAIDQNDVARRRKQSERNRKSSNQHTCGAVGNITTIFEFRVPSVAVDSLPISVFVAVTAMVWQTFYRF